MREMEMALCKRDEIIRQLTSRLQSAASLEADAAQLGQHVQQLQTQLINVWLYYTVFTLIFFTYLPESQI